MTAAGTDSIAAPPRRGRPRNEGIDAAVLDAAIDQLIEHGFSGLSMEAVAVQAGVAKTTVYRRWANTSELSIAAIGRIKGDAVEPPAGSVRDQLLFLMRRIHTVWSDERFAAVIRRVAADGTTRPEAYRESRERLIRPHVQIMQRVMRRAADEGLIRPGLDPELVRQLLVSSVTAPVFAVQPPPPWEQVEIAVDVVLRGAAP